MLLGRKALKILQLRGGVFRESTKKFAEKQMMVVRFDTVHTDSDFQKVWSGM